jgi:hypothetical protein
MTLQELAEALKLAPIRFCPARRAVGVARVSLAIWEPGELRVLVPQNPHKSGSAA